MTTQQGLAAREQIVVKQSKAVRARVRNEKVAAEAGAPGHVVAPGEVPRRRLRTDLVDPVLSFVVYGVPAPQGSKSFKGFRNGKPVLAEQSDGLAPWRKAVKDMSREAIKDWSRRTGTPWAPLDEPVMVSAVVTVPATAAATKRGDTYAEGTPDLDKLERAIGDAISPTPLKPSDGQGYGEAAKAKIRTEMLDQRRKTSVLHDDSRIVDWDHVVKVYPKTTVDSLAYSGVTIQVWRISELEAAATCPAYYDGERTWMTAGDLREWTQPSTGETWAEITERILTEPQDAPEAHAGPIVVSDRAVGEEGVRALLETLLAQGPSARITVTLES